MMMHEAAKNTRAMVSGLVALCLSVLVWAAAGFSAQAEPSIPRAELEAWIDQQMAESGIPGHGLTVVSAAGVLLEQSRASRRKAGR
jgi:hypothetical protein